MYGRMLCCVPVFYCSALKIAYIYIYIYIYIWINNVKYDIFVQAQYRMQGLTVMVPLKKGTI